MTEIDETYGLPDVFESETEDEIEPQIDEYDLTASPNDFNIMTIFNFIEGGTVRIPSFQRHYVWDIKRASRLIESIIIGLPVPQIFLYEQGRNSFLVIDGQQRLMTIFYFMRGRFPKASKRAALRKIFDKNNGIPDEYLDDPEYFDSFKLRLPDVAPGTRNKFSGLTYKSLGEYKTTFELRTIRNMIVKQVKPASGDSSIYEMFNRLNTGGVLLTPQEIRASMYHSSFLVMLGELNEDARWRSLINLPQPDHHSRDIEVLLRATAVWMRGAEYSPSMTTFLNQFAHDASQYDESARVRIRRMWEWFLAECANLDVTPLRGHSGKLSVAIFDAAFAALARRRASQGDYSIPANYFATLVADQEFRENTDDRPTDRGHVRARVQRADEVLVELLSEID